MWYCNNWFRRQQPLVSISDLIAAASDKLTPTERVLASAVAADPMLLAFGKVADLAEQAGTSRPSVVRFAMKLGFEGFTDLQEHVRREVSNRLTRPSERIRHHDDSLTPGRAALESAMQRAFDQLDEGRLARLAKPLVAARHVWVLSGETSQAAARKCYAGLSIVRPDVRWLGNASQIAGAAEGDACVVFDFSRYRRQSIQMARALVARSVALVAITDGPLSPLAQLTDTWCELDVPGIGPFDSSVPALVIAEYLVAQVAAELNLEARERIDRTEQVWDETDTFLPDS